MAKIVYFVTEDWTFVEHRLDLAKWMCKNGWDVLLLTHVNNYRGVIENEGIRVIPLPLSRKGRNPLRELSLILYLFKVLNREKPDILHAVGLKPNIYGSLVARFSQIKGVVFSVAGFGTAFSRRGFLHWCAKISYKISFRIRNSIVIVQNIEDLKLLVGQKLANPDQGVLIRGSGVDTSRFLLNPEPIGIPIILFASRLLRDKGIKELLEASCKLKNNNFSHRLILVGRCDPHNPTSLKDEEIQYWTRQEHIEWWGYRDDMEKILQCCSIVVLPSYHEGLPKILLEAMASGRAIIATDIPGNRELIKHGHNGLLVPVKNVDKLASAIQVLLIDSELRRKFASNGRTLAEKDFDVNSIADEHLKLYCRLLTLKGNLNN